MMDKKILASMLIIAVASTLLGAGTVAYFSDTETSKDNTFTVTTGPDLKLSHSSLDPWTDGVTGTWTLADMKPGDETLLAHVFFKNFGSAPSSTMTITCDYKVTEESPQTESDTDPHTDEHPDEMAKYMVIAYMHYRNGFVDIDCLTGRNSGGPVNEDWRISDTDMDGRITLCDLKQDPLVNLPSPDTQPLKITQLDMRIKFDEDAGNDFQGDIFDLTMIFTLN
jgi:predicted ribosomally synthesized peptide with SipW-like signal peptide